MTKGVPYRWLPYKPHGTVIEGTRIVAFKVPLKQMVTGKLSPDEQFTPEMLMQSFPKLKMIVDLTNTRRYYRPEDFTDAGVGYQKIMIPGQQVPPLECVKQFFKVMHDFETNYKNDEIIGVHCTHGVNRTGYLICRYLVQQLGWEPQKSLKAFEQARGYPIERENYVASLMSVPRVKMDVSSVELDQPSTASCNYSQNYPRKHLMRPGMNGPSQYGPNGHGFGSRVRPYPPPHPRFGGPPPPPPHAFGPRPPIPPPPSPPMGRLYGPRPHAYGMLPMRPPMPPPGPGPFPGARFPPRMQGAPGMPGPPRLPPPPGPPSRLPGPGMGPPRLPPPGMGPPRLPPPGMGPGMGPPRIPPPGMGPGMGPRMGPGMVPLRTPPPGMGPMRTPPPGMGPPRLPHVRKNMDLFKREIQGMSFADACKRNGPPGLQGGALSAKIAKDVDFTVDTFDENLTTTVSP